MRGRIVTGKCLIKGEDRADIEIGLIAKLAVYLMHMAV